MLRSEDGLLELQLDDLLEVLAPGRPRRPPPKGLAPKNASNTSPMPPPKPNGSAPVVLPSTPAWPYAS